MNTDITTKMKITKPASDVFEAIADPEKMGGYWFSSGTGRVEQGKTITWRYEEYGAEGDIHVLEVVENEKIVFNWGETKVTIVFKETDGGTIIEVTESGLKADDPDYRCQNDGPKRRLGVYAHLHEGIFGKWHYDVAGFTG